MMQILSIEKITWKPGKPADWPQIFAPDEVPFACMVCRQVTATHKITLDNHPIRMQVIACPDCITKDAAHIEMALRRKGE